MLLLYSTSKGKDADNGVNVRDVTGLIIIIVIIIIMVIINDNIYGAVLMTAVTARVHPVHLMNAD